MTYAPPRTWAEVPAAVRAGLARPFAKRADGTPGLAHLADVMGWRAGGGPLSDWRGGPRPLANTLIGAGLGALGGYGVGRLGEFLLPERYFTPGAARKRLAILGGALGAVPGAWQAYDNHRQSGGELSSLLAPWPYPEKEAGEKFSGLYDPNIPRDPFVQMVMGDQNTPFPLRAMTAGLVEAASAVRGTDLVSPMDIARVAVGAGSGLVSGVIAGKALGIIAGLTPQGQQKLQDAGMLFGVLKNTVPQALGWNGRN